MSDGHIRNNPALAGKDAYEASRAIAPNYHGGSPRPTWEHLDDLAKWSWERPLRDPIPSQPTISKEAARAR